MKKRVSLILVLLIVFSVLLSTTVSAEKQPQSENEPALDDVSGFTLREDNEVTRTTDVDVPTCCATLTQAPGDVIMGCSHNYKVDMFNNVKHCLVCSKCGKIKSEGHKYIDQPYTGTRHKHICKICKYVAYKEEHSPVMEYTKVGEVYFVHYRCKKCHAELPLPT